MILGIPLETEVSEKRVSLPPDSAARLIKAGLTVLVQQGAGTNASYPDTSYTAAGATIVDSAAALYQKADLIVGIHAPDPARLRRSSALIGLLRPAQHASTMQMLAQSDITAVSLDALPRTTRAQSMDVLSSMSTVAGYRAVIVAAAASGNFFPLLMTAAGTIAPARVLVLGAGVAGLQAIATARRLGAVVQAFDTRAAVAEQVQSLGATFLTLPMAAHNTEGSGGYARQLSEESYRQEQALLADAVHRSDIIITTAMVPGAPAPRLISEAMVAGMPGGSVIVDLAAEAGGNCALTVPGDTIVWNDVTIIGPTNLPATMPHHASQLYGRNAVAYIDYALSHGLTLSAGSWNVTMDDEIVRSTCIVAHGEIRHQATRDALSPKQEEATYERQLA